MRVKFFAQLRDLAGCAEDDAPAAATVGELIFALGERYGRKFRDKLLTAEGELGPEIVVMVNDRHVVHLGGMDAPLKDGDVVRMLPLVTGG